MQKEELAGVIARAQQLQEVTDEQILRDPDSKQLYDAMVEAGLDSNASLLALRERLSVEARPQLKQGDLILVSVDNGWLVPAKFVSEERGIAKVRFMSGTDGEMPLETLRRLQVYPGFKVHCEYYGSWIEAEVTSFNPDALSLQVNYYGSKWNVGLDTVKVKDKSKMSPTQVKMEQLAYYAITAVTSGVLGAIIMRVLMR